MLEESIGFGHISTKKEPQSSISHFTMDTTFAPLDATPEPKKTWAETAALSEPKNESSGSSTEIENILAGVLEFGEKIMAPPVKEMKPAIIIKETKPSFEEVALATEQTKTVFRALANAQADASRWETVLGTLREITGSRNKLFTRPCEGCRHDLCTHSHTAFVGNGDITSAIGSIRASVKALQGDPSRANLEKLIGLIVPIEKNCAGLVKDLVAAEESLVLCKHWESGHCNMGDKCSFGHPVSKKGTKAKPTEAEIRAAKRQTVTCKHWLAGRCKHSAEECDFAHKNL